MTANQAIEILKNAQNYSMVEIREAEQVIESMVEKAEAFDEFYVLFGRHFYANKESDINYLTDDEFVEAVEELRSNKG